MLSYVKILYFVYVIFNGYHEKLYCILLSTIFCERKHNYFIFWLLFMAVFEIIMYSF